MVSVVTEEIKDKAYLRSLNAVRTLSNLVYSYVRSDQSQHLWLDESKLSEVADFVVGLMERDYGRDQDGKIRTASVPPHSRWRHYGQAEIDKLVSSIRDNNEKCKLLLDLFIVSVLLDAGAGAAWKYTDGDGKVYTRSEGLALATLRMLQAGLFGKHVVEAGVLAQLSSKDLASGLQVSSSNPIVGLEGRVQLLRSLAKTLLENGFARPSDFLDKLLDTHHNEIPLTVLWSVVMDVFGKIWPDASGLGLGDAWRHASLGIIVPFHKLSQWLTYSLIEPIQAFAEYQGKPVKITGSEALTGLPEYRNGGLLVDFGVINSKAPLQSYDVSHELIVEWRALTVVLLDKLAGIIRQHPDIPKDNELSLPMILEGGTWKAGREIAKKLRPTDAASPIRIVSDGTVF